MARVGKRHRFLITRSALAAVTAAGLTLTGCSATSEAPSNEDRPLVVAQSADVLSLDPTVDTAPISWNVFANIFDQLTIIGPDGSVVPQLATSWTTNDDGSEWTFKLRDDVKFSDDSPLTADDVVWSFTMIMTNPSSPGLANVRQIESVDKVNDFEVKFTLTGPFAPFDRQVSLVSILPQKAYESMGAEAFAQAPVGSGAYRVVSWVKDDHIELVANDDYWNGAPKIRNVVFRPVPSESARTGGLLTGELDIVSSLPPSSVQQLEAAENINVAKVVSNQVAYLAFNMKNPALNVELRRAVDLAIDRSAITESLLAGLGEPTGQIVAPVTFGFDDSIEPTAYEPEKAKDLVEASGYDGSEILLQYPNNLLPLGTEVVQAVAGYLHDVGINVKLEGMEYSAFFPLWASNKLEGIHLFAFAPSIMDANLPLGSLFLSGSKGTWNNPTVDSLIRQQLSQVDPDERLETIGSIWKLSQEEVPYSPLYSTVQVFGVAKVVDWTARPDGRLYLKDATYVDGE